MPGTPKRFDKGVTNDGVGKPFQNAPFLNPLKYYMVLNDCHDLVGTGESVTWSSNTSDAQSADALLDVAFGGWNLSSTSADGTSVYFFEQETIGLVSGKKAWFGIRLQAQDTITKLRWEFGVGATATGNILGTSLANHMCIKVDETDANVDIRVAKASAQTDGTGLATHVTATWEAYDVYFDGVSKFELYKDQVLVGSVTTTAWPTVLMQPYFAWLCGAATNVNYYVDYMYAIVER